MAIGLYDQNHFGCILAGREKQFQCDHGKASWTGWYIGYEGIVTLHGSAQWWACPTGDHSGHNIYKAPLPGDYCSEVTLVANRCRAVREAGICYGPRCPKRTSPPVSPPVSPPRHNFPSISTPRCASPPCTQSIPTSSRSMSAGSVSSVSVSSRIMGSKSMSSTCSGSGCLRSSCSGSGCLNRSSRCPGELSGNWEVRLTLNRTQQDAT